MSRMLRSAFAIFSAQKKRKKGEKQSADHEANSTQSTPGKFSAFFAHLLCFPELNQPSWKLI